MKIDIPREFYNEVIDYNNFDERIHILKQKIQSLDNKPMLNLTVVGGDFDSADVYESIQKTIGDDVLNLRPSFKPDKVLDEEKIIDENKILDPRTLLHKRVNEKYSSDDVNRLSLDLLDNLSVGRVDDAKIISDRYYSEHYYNEEEEAELIQSETNESDSLDDYLDENLDSYDDVKDVKEGYDNQKSKQMSFDDF